MANKIRQSNIDPSIITGNTELAETMNVNDVLLIYDQTAGTLKKVTRANLLGAPTVSSVSPTSVVSGDGTGNYTFTITGTDFAGAATAQLLTSGGSPVNFDTVTRDSSTQITGVVAKSSLTNANEPYGVRVDNGNGTTDDLTGQINIDAQPAYTTAAGSLGFFSQGAAVSVSVNATDPESAGNVTFELQSGTLPPGFTLTNNAADGGTVVIAGTAPTGLGSTTTYNFVIRAADAASNTSSRAFSISVIAPTSESFTSSGTFSVPAYVSAVDVLVVAGGGAGGYNIGGGAGAGGLVFVPCYPVTPGGTVSVTVGDGGTRPCGSPTNTSENNGQDSVFGTLTAKGGGGGGIGGATTACVIGAPGGSGGGGGRDNASRYGTPNFGAATQPTQPGQSGAYGFGNNGGNVPLAGTDFVGSAGGGGAGAVGGNGAGGGSPTEDGGDGGIGKAYTIADGTTPVYYAGGGGGAFYAIHSGNPQTLGGQGGGGNGQKRQPTNELGAQSGEANKGGGGGGGSLRPGNPVGGKGIVIVRY